MALTAEVDTWLQDLEKTGEVSTEWLAETRKQLEKPKAQEFVKGSVLRQSDYSKKANDLKAAQEKAQAEYDAKMAEVDTKFKYYSDYGADADKKVKAAQKAHDELQGKLDAISRKAKRWVEQGVIDEDEVKDVLTGDPTTERRTEQQRPLADDDTIKRLDSRLTEEFKATAKLPAIMQKISTEHFKLYGEWPDMEALLEKAEGSGKSLKQTWEAEYKVADKREELREAAVQDRINRETEKRLTARLSEMNLPTQPKDRDRTSPVFKAKPSEPKTVDAHTHTTQTPSAAQKQNSVANAVKAYRERLPEMLDRYEGRAERKSA